MIEIRNIKKIFNKGTINEQVALKGVNLTLNEGDFVTIIGGNGAGKSTLLNVIAGSIEADEGLILLNETDVSHLKEHQRAAYFGRVFQDPMKGTATDMTVLENLALAYGRGKPRSLFRWSIRNKDKEFFIEELKKLDLGLEDKIYQKVGLLSGGQRQALTLLMATIAQRPSHRTIIKDYVKFANKDKEIAKEEVEKAYKDNKQKYISKKKEIELNKSLSLEEKRKLIKEAYDEFDVEIRKFDVTKPILLLDEHTAALDPKTAKNVLELTNRLVFEDHLTTIMVTHNMNDAIKYGNRLIMMSKGNIVIDIKGEDKKKLTIEDLLNMYSTASKDDVISDSAILG